MIYIKNTNTKEIEQFSSIPLNYYGTGKENFINANGITCQRPKLKNEYVILTENDAEVQEILLEEAKEKKIIEIKKTRDEELQKDHIHSFAEELKYINGNFKKTGNIKSFKFSIKSTGIVITEPKAIIDYALKKNNGEFTPYSCKFEDDAKGYVAIDNIIAKSIESHLRTRGINIIIQANLKKEEINALDLEKFKYSNIVEKLQNIAFFS